MKKEGVTLTGEEAAFDSRPLLKVALSRFFGTPKGLVSLLVEHIPSPVDYNKNKVNLNFHDNTCWRRLGRTNISSESDHANPIQ